MALIFGIILWSLISMIWSTNVYAAWEGILPWISAFVFGMILINSISDMKGMLSVLKTILYFSTALALIGVFQGLIGWDLIPQLKPPAITFVNRNSAALLMSFAFPIAFIATFAAEKKGEKAVALLCLLVIVWFVWLTGTRSAFLSLGVQTILCPIWLIWKQKSFRFITFSIASVIVILMTVGAILLVKVGTLENPNKDLQASVEVFEAKYLGCEECRINTRIPHWVNTFSLVKENPLLGTGFGNWKIEVIPYLHTNLANFEHIDGIDLLQLHNDPIQFIAEFGLFGLAFMILGILYFLRNGRQLLGDKTEDEYRIWYFAPFSAILGIVVGANLSFPLHLPIHILLFVTMIALITWICKHNGQDEFANLSLRKFNILFAGIAIVIAILTIRYHTAKLKSDTLSKLAELSMDTDPQNAMRKARLAKKTFSNNQHAQLMMCFAHMHLGEMGRAEQMTREYLIVEPYSLRALSLLSEIYYKTDKIEESAEMIRYILEMHPRSVARRRNLGFLLFYKLNKVDEGLEEFRKLLDYDRKERSLFLVGGDLLARQDTVRYKEIIHYLHERFPENEEYTTAFEGLGD